MRHFHLVKNRSFRPVANLDQLWHLIGEQKLADAQAGKFKGQAIVVDMTDHGIYKLLGKGRIPKVPLVVKARYFSSLAERKIKEAGGVCELTA
jgi:large subunit ribosomal protein L27Ae